MVIPTGARGEGRNRSATLGSRTRSLQRHETLNTIQPNILVAPRMAFAFRGRGLPALAVPDATPLEKIMVLRQHFCDCHRASRFLNDIEALERRLLFAAGTRSFDGTGNNLGHVDWGSAGSTLLRLAPAQYADGLSAPAGATRPSPRVISNEIVAHPKDEMISPEHLAAYAYAWGQFIDHDMDLTPAASPPEPFNVNVPKGDPQFDPNSTGTQIIPLLRSEHTSDRGPRQQVSDITAWIDGSMIYGSSASRDAALRAFSGGRLKTSSGDLLPFNTAGLPNSNDAHLVPDNQLFLAGDVRANENVELTALQTLFMREHNRLAGIVAKQHPTWNDERVFQRARQLVIGELQNVTYTQFLPALLGSNALPAYTGYKSNVNPDTATEFSTAAFRIGHSMLTNDIELFNNAGKEIRDQLPLAQLFSNPGLVQQMGIDPIVKYLASNNSEPIDNVIVDGLRNFLFGPPGSGGMDLASLNIQRGRDHGLADYNTTRAAVGLPRVTSFDQITSDSAVADELRKVYGNVNNIDLWVGGLAEDHVGASAVGPTFSRIIADQFRRVRDGDRYWYERTLTGSDLALVRGTTLKDVIAANTGISNLQDNVFIFNATISGRVYRDANQSGKVDGGEEGLSGMKLQLIDDETGDVVKTTTSTRSGNYSFSAVALGDYVVRTSNSSQRGQSRTIDITRGSNVSGVNVSLPRLPSIQPASSTSVFSDSQISHDIEEVVG